MPENKKAKELMVPISEYPVVYDTDSIKDAIMVLKEHFVNGTGHRSLLVLSKTKKINNEDELVGIVTIRDILHAIKRKIMAYDIDELYSMSWALFFRHEYLRETTAEKTGDIIKPLVHAYIQTGEDVSVAIRKMMTKNVNILPVFEGNKVVGILRAVDILDYIAEML